jgi:ABC-type multidrug transport system fused ATPase/permease subunit
MAQKVHVERDDPTLRLKFPNPTFPPGVALEHSPLVCMENVSFGYKADERFLLQDVTLHLTRGSKVALVGVNGNGKTTFGQVDYG